MLKELNLKTLRRYSVCLFVIDVGIGIFFMRSYLGPHFGRGKGLITIPSLSDKPFCISCEVLQPRFGSWNKITNVKGLRHCTLWLILLYLSFFDAKCGMIHQVTCTILIRRLKIRISKAYFFQVFINRR